MEWQAIESAPRDGTEIIAYAYGVVRIASYSNQDWYSHGKLVRHTEGWSPRGISSEGKYQPTHWIAVPDLPYVYDGDQ